MYAELTKQDFFSFYDRYAADRTRPVRLQKNITTGAGAGETTIVLSEDLFAQVQRAASAQSSINLLIAAMSRPVGGEAQNGEAIVKKMFKANWNLDEASFDQQLALTRDPRLLAYEMAAVKPGKNDSTDGKHFITVAGRNYYVIWEDAMPARSTPTARLKPVAASL